MTRKHQMPFVELAGLLASRYPELPDPSGAIGAGRVLVDNRILTNPHARVRRDAATRVLPQRKLRGQDKLETALTTFDVNLTNDIAVDVGASAGGFTSALLHAGAARVYAVDVGFGQLLGRLRADPRVVNLERTNVADLDPRTVPDTVDLVTMDLSYISVGTAVGQLEGLPFADDAKLLALVKPTFELRRPRLASERGAVREAASAATAAIERHQWRVLALSLPAVTGTRDAVELFVFARRARPNNEA